MDYLADTGQQVLHKLMKQYDIELPGFIKLSSALSDRPSDVAPQTVYGNPVRRTFPCHTKSATFLSAMYHYGQEQDSDQGFPTDKIAERIERAAGFWGIAPEVHAIKSAMRAKQANPERELTDADFALVADHHGEHIRRFPVVNAVSVKKSAQNLYDNRVQYPMSWRKLAARNLLKSAASLGLQPDEVPNVDYLVKAAGYFPREQADIAEQLEVRALIHTGTNRDLLRKSAEAIRSGYAGIHSLCDAVDSMDRETRTYTMYRDGMPMPEEVFFDGIPKQAEAEPAVTLTTGNTYKLADLQRVGIQPFTVLPADYILDLAADDHGSLDVKRASELLPTVPRDEAALVDSALAASGVMPVTSEKQAAAKASEDERRRWIQACNGDVVDEDFRISVTLPHPQGLHAAIKAKEQQ